MASSKSAKRSPKSRQSRAVQGHDVSAAQIHRTPRVHTFERVVAMNDIPKTLIDQGYAISFRLDDLPGYTEFTNLFDNYRLNWVEYVWQLKVPINNCVQVPVIYYAEDHDDTTVPTLIDMQQKQSCEMITFGSDRTQIKRRVTPNADVAVYQTGVSSAYSRGTPGMWMSCAYPAVLHYGVKYFIQNYNTTSFTSTYIAVGLRYSVSFKEAL